MSFSYNHGCEEIDDHKKIHFVCYPNLMAMVMHGRAKRCTLPNGEDPELHLH